MGFSILFLVFLVSIAFLIFLNHLIFVAIADSALIQQTCKSTKYYELCVSSLKSNPASPKADTKGLAVIMVGVGISNATATASYLSSQVVNTSTNGTLIRKVLKQCADKYSYATNALQSTLGDLSADSFDYASMHVMAAADYPNACHNAFKRYSGLPYPPELAAREDGLKRICDVVLDIIDLLGW
ncbi:Pectinesterase [Bertholletia excelsa]